MKQASILEKQKIMGGLKVFITLTIVSILIIMIVTANKQTIDVIKQVNILILAFAFILLFIYVLFDALKLKALTLGVTNQNISVKTCAEIILTGNFLAAVTPFQMGGIPIELYILKKHKVGLGKGSFILIARGLLYAVFILIFTPLILKYYFSYARNLAKNLMVYALFIYFIAGVSLVLILSKPEPIKRFILRRLRKKRFRFKKVIITLIRELEEIKHGFLQLIKQNRVALYKACAYTIVSLIAYYLIAPTIIYALGFHVNIIEVIVIQLLIVVLTFFFPTPGASGMAEFVSAGLFSIVLPKYALGMFVVLSRLIMFYIGVIIGGILTLRLVYKK